MRKIFLFLVVLLIIQACSSDGSDEMVQPVERLQINNVSPSRVKIGDTIKITGNRLDLIEELLLFNEKQTHPNDQPFTARKNYFITQTEGEITLKIPHFFHEKMTIDFKNEDNTTWDLELYGMVPIFQFFDYIENIQVVNANIAFLYSNNAVYKSVDGFHNWNEIITGQITSFYFMNSTTGWVAIRDGDVSKIYLTHDGGVTFNEQHTFPVPIRKLKFTSMNKGYLVTGEPHMYIFDNGVFTRASDYYPELKNQSLITDEIWDFSLINDDVLFLISNWPDDPIIRIESGNITLFNPESASINPPQFIDNVGYILTFEAMYKSFDQGISWEKISSFNNFPRNFNFINGQHGFLYVDSSDPPFLDETLDGGLTWRRYYTFGKLGTSHRIGPYHDFSNTNGLIGGGVSLFKYKP